MGEDIQILIAAEESRREGLGKALENRGFVPTLREAPDAASVMRALAEPHLDCAILEHGMADIDVAAILQEIAPLRGRVPPIVAILECPDEALAVELKDLGAAECLTAPAIDSESLAETVSRLVETGRAASAPAAERGSAEGATDLEAAFDQIAIGIAHVATDGTILRVNPRLCEILRCSEDAIRGRAFRDLQHPDDVVGADGSIHRLLRGDLDICNVERRLLRPDGSVLWANAMLSAVRDADGTVRFLVAAVEDVTTRRVTEERLQAVTEELSRSNKELEEFVHIVSHDLREPLRMVSGFVHLLKERFAGQIAGGADRYIEFALGGARRMDVLLNELLRYSRLGQTKIDCSPIAMDSVLDDVLDNLQSLVERTGATIEKEPLPEVEGNGPLIGQVFQNLIENAIKYAKDGPPKIRISAAPIEDGWRFCVEDDGIGFDPKDQDRIFGIFQRLHADGEYSGTGVGLAVSKRIVTRHSGRIWAESQLGAGSRFFFTLPARRADA